MNRTGSLIACVALAAVAVAVEGGATATAKGCKPKNGCQRPEVTSLGATSTVATEGTITVTASVTAATSCTLSSNKPVAGLPLTFSCESGTVAQEVVMPANTGTKAVEYRFTLLVSGPGGTRKVRVGGSVEPLPRVRTTEVSSVTSTEATITAVIEPNGFQTGWEIWIVRVCKHSECIFEHPIAEGTLPAGFDPVLVEGTATELEPGTTYGSDVRLRYGAAGEEEFRGRGFRTPT